MLPVSRPAGLIGAILLAAGLFATGPLSGVAAAGSLPPGVAQDSFELDVPFVPTDREVVALMLDLAAPGPGDYLIDLGSGDGRIVLAAASRFGIAGHGVELNPGLVALSRDRAAREGLSHLARFYRRDLFDEDLSPATIITMYLLPEVVLALRERLLALKPGTRIVSHDYHLGEWRPDEIRLYRPTERGHQSVLYSWVVPARVAGIWTWELPPGPFGGNRRYRLRIGQHFQDIEGRLEVEGTTMPLHEAILVGDRIRFAAAGPLGHHIVYHAFEGIVRDDRIEGRVRVSGGVPEIGHPWKARRVETR